MYVSRRRFNINNPLKVIYAVLLGHNPEAPILAEVPGMGQEERVGGSELSGHIAIWKIGKLENWKSA